MPHDDWSKPQEFEWRVLACDTSPWPGDEWWVISYVVPLGKSKDIRLRRSEYSEDAALDRAIEVFGCPESS